MSQIERSGPAGVGYSETVTAKPALPGTGRNQGSVSDRGVPATACGGCGLHGLGEGPGRWCRFFRPGAFHIPVMALSILPTGCSTEIGDNPFLGASQ